MEAVDKAPYLVNLRRGLAEFIWSSTPRSPTGGSIDLRLRAEPEELLWLAKCLNCEVNENEILPLSLDSYNRLLLYTAVRATLRKGSKISDLALLVQALNRYDVHYWASALRELWWKYERYRPLMRVAKAFKLFFDLR